MSNRYSKVLTWQNLQLFAGGLMLTGTAGYVWIKPRMERTQELRTHLHKIQQNMYWSMSLTQRTDIPLHSSQIYQGGWWRWRLERANAWWNSKVSRFNSWIMEPGYVAHEAGRVQKLAGQGAARGWNGLKRLVGHGGAWTVSQAKTAIHWPEARQMATSVWESEKSKWSLAHARAIEAVHPWYQKTESGNGTTSVVKNR